MRSAVIVILFLFSIFFLGAQAAQLDPPATAEDTGAAPARHVSTGLLQPAAY